MAITLRLDARIGMARRDGSGCGIARPPRHSGAKGVSGLAAARSVDCGVHEGTSSENVSEARTDPVTKRGHAFATAPVVLGACRCGLGSLGVAGVLVSGGLAEALSDHMLAMSGCRARSRTTDARAALPDCNVGRQVATVYGAS